jgi:hypothetical protein
MIACGDGCLTRWLSWARLAAVGCAQITETGI